VSFSKSVSTTFVTHSTCKIKQDTVMDVTVNQEHKTLLLSQYVHEEVGRLLLL